MALPNVLLLALALGVGLVCVDAAATAMPGQGRFTLAPRSNTSGGCSTTVNWPGTQFVDNQWSYTPYACDNYWAYSYTINVTAQPSGFGWNTVTKGFLWSTATIANTGADAPIDYTVTMECPQHGSSQVTCSGTLNPGDPSVDCQVGTVAGMFCDVDYVSVIAIRNPDWFAMAEGSISVAQLCTYTNIPAGADLCSNGTFYGFLATQSSPPLLGYVTGGCVAGMAPGANCGAASFCCPDGSWPANTTSCGSGDGTTDSPCYDCTGGC